MGLDMYAYFIDLDAVIDDFDFDRNGIIDQFYWSKNRHLNNWMENLWAKRLREQGIIPDYSFNCVPIRLYKKDLYHLKYDIVHDNLPGDDGPFFGDNNYTDTYKEGDLEFVEKALAAIEDKKAVYYDSWW